MKRLFGVCCLGVVLMGGAQAGAAMLYQQPLATEPEGFYSNSGGQEAADQFVLGAGGTVTGVTWYGLYASGAGVQDPTAISPIDFGIRFFADNTGLPGTLLSDQDVSALVQDSGFTVTAGSFLGHAIYQFQADLPADVSVGAGATTWLSIIDTDPDTLGLWWLWSYSPSESDDTKAWRLGTTGAWALSESNGQLAFTLEGESVAIPAPGALVLGGIGVGLLGWWRRRSPAR